jgi:hypothetical protein
MPPTLIQHLRQYANKYLPNASINLPEGENSELNLWPVQMRWIQVDSNFTKSAKICTQAVLDMPLWAESETLAYPDITLLVQTHNFGLLCVELLAQKNIGTAHVFGETWEKQKPRKLGFFMGDSRVKASTIESFKGWEFRGRQAPYNACCISVIARNPR